MAAPINPIRGSAHCNAKLTEDDVRLILSAADERKKLLAEAYQLSNSKLAEKFEVSKHTVEKISQGRSWAHV